MSGIVEGAAKGVTKALTDGPIKQSISSVFDGINRGVESFDPLGKYTKQQRKLVKGQVENVKLLGMTAPIALAEIYYPTHISTTIARRLYEQEWQKANSIGSGVSTRRQVKGKTTLPGDIFIEEYKKVVILGGPGAGKTTFLKSVALAYADGSIKINTNLKKQRFLFLHTCHRSLNQLTSYLPIYFPL